MKRRYVPRWKINIVMLFPLFVLGVGLLLCLRQGGFHVDKIVSNLPFNDYWEIDPPTESQRELLTQKIFPQTFYYLKESKRCYAFVSEDNQYVVKFFLKDSWSPKWWLKQHPLPFLRYLGYQVFSDSSYLSEHLFTNYKSVYESFRHETNLVYLHLNKRRDFKMLMTLVDQKGRKHKVDLDHMEFIIQKRGEPLFEKLEALTQDERGFRHAISSFLHLIAVRCEKGFACQNVSLHNRYGFIGDIPFQFDCSILSPDLSMKSPLNIRKEILLAVDKLDLWIKEKHPELSIILQEEAERLLDQTL